MTYPLCFTLDGFTRIRPHRARAVVQHLVNALVELNIGYLESHGAPPLYGSGIFYRADVGNVELQWYDIPAILRRGYADCKGLAAWRAAEVGGRAMVISNDSSGIRSHVVTVHQDGTIEDPSIILGMR